MAHAKLAPSSANRWRFCAGSILMGEMFPETGTHEIAEEGTASHWVASEVLSGRGPDPFVGRTAPNGIVITEEMVDGAKVYVQAVRDAHPLHGVQLHVEEPLTMERIHPECWGTPDLWYYLPQTKELHVWDYKYGFGIVDPIENWQGICYATGALEKARGNVPLGSFDQDVTIVIHIVQPRPFHVLGPVREWRVEAAGQFRGYVNQLNQAASQALSDNPQCLAGEKYCRYCSARHACPAAQSSALHALDYSYAAVPELLSPDAAATELRTLQRALEALEYRMTGLETQIIETLKSGHSVNGFAIEYGKGRETWSTPVSQIIALGESMGIDLKAPDAVCTPTQAKRKGLSADLVNAFTSVPSTGIKLVNADKSMANQVFGKPTT